MTGGGYTCVGGGYTGEGGGCTGEGGGYTITGGLVRGGGYTSLKMEWRERLDRWTRALAWSVRRPFAVHAIDA